MARGGVRGNRGNQNPVAGRLAKKAQSKPGTLADVQARLWEAIIKAETVMEKRGQKDETVLRAANCIGQLAMSYSKVLEVGEYEARLAAVEAALRRDQEG